MHACREVFTPFSIKLRNTKPVSRPYNDTHSAGSRTKCGETTQVVVPFINVTMDSREFAILLDVIMHVGVAEVASTSALKARKPCDTPGYGHLPPSGIMHDFAWPSNLQGLKTSFLCRAAV